MAGLQINRRQFLRQSFAFSAAAGLGALQASAFSLPGANRSASHLLMLGDWGKRSPDNAQAQVASSMAAYKRTHSLDVQALLMLGDNWYDELSGVDDPRWQTDFEQMYPREVFDCPAYAIAGNHDYQILPINKVEAELEYARRSHSRWTMPSLWYRFTFPRRNPTVTFLALDSNYHHESGKPIELPDFTLTPEKEREQTEWLRRELARPRTTPFLCVLAHHPLYSNKPDSDSPVLIREWDALLRQHRVDVYVSGHHHDLQHMEFEGHPTSFFLSGGGAAHLDDVAKGADRRGPYAEMAHGFSHMEATRSTLTFRHVDVDGKVLHTFSRDRAGKVLV